jgi:tRNA pseudouridine38-40 synthase
LRNSSDADKINLKLVIEYDGKNYSGWQRQTKLKSIQQTIEDALSVLFKGEKITIMGAGRTDAGVHAYGQAANFRVSKEKYKAFGKNKLIYSLNALLPDDILIKELKTVPEDFNSRYSAISREYIYRITTTRKAIAREQSYYIKYDIDIKAAKDFCKTIEGWHSFRSLCKNKKDDHGFNCNVMKVEIRNKKDGILEFKITANRFLHSMVRAIIGAMLKVASGKLSLNEFIQKFKKGDEIKTQYVPSHALFLSKVNY